MFSSTSSHSLTFYESGSAQMRRGKYHIVWTSPLLYGEAVQNVTRSQRRDTQTHTWSWWGTARSSLYAVYLYSILVPPLPMYYCATLKRDTQAHTCSGHWGRGGGGGNGQLLTAGLLLRTVEVVAEVGHGHLLNMVVSQEN